MSEHCSLCHRPAEYRYKVLEGGDWRYLCFEHRGMTAIARVKDKDAIYTTSFEALPTEGESDE